MTPLRATSGSPMVLTYRSGSFLWLPLLFIVVIKEFLLAIIYYRNYLEITRLELFVILAIIEGHQSSDKFVSVIFRPFDNLTSELTN